MNTPDWPWPRWREELRTWRGWLSPRSVWARLMHNPGPKTLALIVAVTLWFVATADRRVNVELGFDVPITVRDTTPDRGEGTRAVSDLTPPTVQVTLSGRPDRLRELRPEAIEVVVDVTSVPEGRFTRPVAVSAPGGTSVRRFTPARVEGFVDAGMTRTLPLTLSVATPSETGLPRYEVTPREVSVSGSGRVVGTVARVVTSPAVVPAAGVREVPLLALDAAGAVVPGVQLSPATATVRRLDSGELPVKALRVVLNDPPAGLRVSQASVQPSTVRVVAAPELLARLREVGGSVSYRAGTYTAPVRLNVPQGAQALETVSVRLTVEAVPQDQTP